ncbi:tail fiber assembly protein [Salmonella enterica]|nr:phage tail protein [Salmonella enterica]ELH4155819.1 tail fiber assembly protein [Salmonella enterica]ELP5617143.1 tail fiber assembly protein [Salmonella enterica]
MKYYIDGGNNVYAYEDDVGESFIQPSLTEISEEEAMSIANPPPTHEELIQLAGNKCQQLLSHADAIMLEWRTALMLGEISDTNRAKLSAWLDYKNEVKAVDVTTDPEHINWPVQPEA